MNYQAHDDVINKAAEHLANLLIAAEIPVDSKNNEFYCAFASMYWKNYVALGLRNKGDIEYKTRKLVKAMQKAK
jgi:hypothetical protein